MPPSRADKRQLVEVVGRDGLLEVGDAGIANGSPEADCLLGRVGAVGVDEQLGLRPDGLADCAARGVRLRQREAPQSLPTFIFTRGMPWLTQPASCSRSSSRCRW